jgi:1-acyl-sn-glycerol-3-phosphate acyltransferase
MTYPWAGLPGFEDVDSVENRDPETIRKIARAAWPLLKLWFSPDVRGLDRIPEGPALYVANHSGGFVSPDTWVFAAAVLRDRGIEHVPYGLTHQAIIEAPLLNRVLTKIGGIEAKPANAHRVFARGGKVLVYPGGDLDAFRPSRDGYRVVFGPRRGYVRTALREGVPIVPVVSAGGHQGWVVLSDGKWLAKRLRTHRVLRTDVLPITLSLPWGIAVGAPPYVPWPTPISIEVLEPIVLDRTGERAADDGDYVEACHVRVHGAMQAALDRLARARRARRLHSRILRRSNWTRARSRVPL